ncbi:30S ribosomal protein S17 [Candidatus Parcubacteria bacterium]|nr:MAG: 30S ribosomal protein S17 [Candidatus Parcubacteria bacterium]
MAEKKKTTKKATPKKVEHKQKEVIRKKFHGVVVSDKMDKTVVVRVDRVVVHPKYKKRYTVSKKYKCHDEKNEFKEGDKVTFTECRPMSKNKRWRVIK